MVECRAEGDGGVSLELRGLRAEGVGQGGRRQRPHLMHADTRAAPLHLSRDEQCREEMSVRRRSRRHDSFTSKEKTMMMAAQPTKILVADEDPPLLRLVARILELEGYR